MTEANADAMTYRIDKTAVVPVQHPAYVTLYLSFTEETNTISSHFETKELCYCFSLKCQKHGARTHTRMHARTHARTHTHTHTQTHHSSETNRHPPTTITTTHTHTTHQKRADIPPPPPPPLPPTHTPLIRNEQTSTHPPPPTHPPPRATLTDH